VNSAAHRPRDWAVEPHEARGALTQETEPDTEIRAGTELEHVCIRYRRRRTQVAEQLARDLRVVVGNDPCRERLRCAVALSTCFAFASARNTMAANTALRGRASCGARR
jgi:hypothetical protein